MKHFLNTTLILFVSICLKAQKDFVVKGVMNNVNKPAKAILQYRNGDNTIIDSTMLKNGKFQFTGKVTIPVRATITLKPLNDDGVWTIEKYLATDKQDFFLENGTITIKGDNAKTANIRAGKTQDEYRLLVSQCKPYSDPLQLKGEKMAALVKQKDEEGVKGLRPELINLRKEITRVEKEFIQQHPGSYVSFDLVRAMSSIIEPKTFEPVFAGLSERIRNTSEGKQLAAKLAIAKKTGIGQPALNFTQNNTQDVPVSLSSLKGKYVLVDFWASWCGPCRAENPNVVKAYNKFKDRNFEILGVSLDNKKDPWLKAIEKDGLPWIHVSDLQGWKNEVAQQYGITAVPQNLLLDPNGIIIAKNLRGEELDKKLTELIK